MRSLLDSFMREKDRTIKPGTRLSKLHHTTFEARQTIDYRKMADVTAQEAAVHVQGHGLLHCLSGIHPRVCRTPSAPCSPEAS
jgi:hypothetical protein